jgi:hypothetical protein
VIKKYPSTIYSALVDNGDAANEMSDACSAAKLKLNVSLTLTLA